ncbi:MAG: hypothetical protein Q8L98_05075 [Chlamydiales bacterium]|nr:hypothetical protein [Chlamydiales bacterium]
MFDLHSEAAVLIGAALEHLKEYKDQPILASQEDYELFRAWSSRPDAPAVPKKPVIVASQPVEKEVLLSKIEKKTPQIFLSEGESRSQSTNEEKHSETKPQQTKIDSSESFGIKPEKPISHATETIPKVSLKPALAEEPLPISQDLFTDLRKLWTKINPGAPVLEALPDDEIAKKIAQRWKVKNAVAEISILSYHEPPAQKALLEQIAKAINILLKPTQIVLAEPIEKEKQWEAFLTTSHLKYTIACDYTLWQLGGLMQHYRETPGGSVRHLGSVPLFLLPDLSLYLKDPLLKRSLWKALCQTLCS